MSRIEQHLHSPAPRLGFRCRSCGYGAVRRIEPQRCPMCGSSTWLTEGWRPYAPRPRRVEPDIEYPEADEPSQVGDSSLRPA